MDSKILCDIFAIAWEQRKVSEITTSYSGGTPKASIAEYYGGEIPFIRSGEIYGNATELFITKEGMKNSSAKMVHIGNILYALYGATSGEVSRAKLDGAINQAILAIIPNADINANFLVEWFRKEKEKITDRYLQGGQGNLSAQIIKELEVHIPSSGEQNKIGEYFSALDHLITLHQRKLEHVKDLKKSMLQKMFPKNGQSYPEVRFPGFTDAWEQRKWCDTVDISTEMVDPTSGEYDDMPHIAPGNIESFTGRILDNVKSVKEEQLISGKFRFRPGDVVYGKINPQLGKYFYASVDGLTSADAYVFNGKNGVTQKFLFSLLQTEDFFKYSVSVSKRSGMPKINRDELNAYGFLAPKEEEQEQIGSFLLEIDNLITLHQRELDHLQLLKKGMLQQMFV